MSAFQDLSGQVFGRLKVLDRTKIPQQWTCECLECGRVVPVYSFNLKSGRTKSCGCLKKKSKKTI